MTFSTEHIKYLERTFLTSSSENNNTSSEWISPISGSLNLFRINQRREQQDCLNEDLNSIPELFDVLVGLYSLRSSFIFLITGSAGNVNFYVGSCYHPNNEFGFVSDEKQANFLSLLNGNCPALAHAELDGEHLYELSEHLQKLDKVALSVGTPNKKYIRNDFSGGQIDRIIRSLNSCSWAYIVTATPLSENSTHSFFTKILNEIRMVINFEYSSGASNPIANKYKNQLEELLKKVQSGKNEGIWNVASFLLSDDESSLARLGAAVGSSYNGSETILDPVRWIKTNLSAHDATSFKLPAKLPPSAPGKVEYPFFFLSLLNSSELSTICQFPQNEIAGFDIIKQAQFDVNPTRLTGIHSFHIGDIINCGKPIGKQLRIEPASLCRHTLVVGTTGSGKTNTISYLIHQLAQKDIPFLVIEPVKNEYRSLLNVSPFDKSLQIFTPGNERCSPLRINPLEVLPNNSVSRHIDLLRAAFSASFGLWTPLPQVLELALHEIYKDKGWDLTQNTNCRIDDVNNWTDAFPTLTDLVNKIQLITKELGYSRETTAEIRSALVTRINALRIGGKGKMLDVRCSTPASQLFTTPTVIELEGIGSDEDKAFIMALLTIQLVGFRRLQGYQKHLSHLLVIEEAHRLLAETKKQKDERAANARGNAVESFVNLLAEVRAYGQGILATDQVPEKLASGVIKNTNLKIVHRLVDKADRELTGNAMVMSSEQKKSLASLSIGEAAVFGNGDDRPLLIQIPRSPLDGNSFPGHSQIVKHMDEQLSGLSSYVKRFAPCSDNCSNQFDACENARNILEDKSVRQFLFRIILSSLEEAGAFIRFYSEFRALVLARKVRNIPEDAVFTCVIAQGSRWVVEKLASYNSWTFGETKLMGEIIQTLMCATARGKKDEFKQTLPKLKKIRNKLFKRKSNPFPGCSKICQQSPPVCYYRQATEKYVKDEKFLKLWKEESQISGVQERVRNQRKLCIDAAYGIIEFPSKKWPKKHNERIAQSVRRVALCLGQQVICQMSSKHYLGTQIEIDTLIKFTVDVSE